MNYLVPSDYESYGLDTATPTAWVNAASALIDAHCRRPTLAVASFVERSRLPRASATVRLSHLPVVEVTSARARYAPSKDAFGSEGLAFDVAMAFALPGTWSDLSVSVLDCCSDTGEVTVGMNPLGLAYNEVEITYMAGMETIPEAVKVACAHMVRTIQATPALSVRSQSLDQMRIEYFSESLLDEHVKILLAPFVSRKVG
jgi:hypothetical protein